MGIRLMTDWRVAERERENCRTKGNLAEIIDHYRKYPRDGLREGYLVKECILFALSHYRTY